MSTRKAADKIPLIDLKISAAARREVNDSLKSGWLSPGLKTAKFEALCAKYLGVPVVAVSSCTIGLEMVLSAVGAGPGKQVVTSPFTFAATLGAIMRTGAQPMLADIDPDTLTIDPDEVERKIGDHTVAVVPVDIAGHPCDYDRLTRICDDRKIPLVADAAHAIGARYEGKSIAQLADVAVYSTYATKNLTTGEGGLIASRHEELVKVMKVMSRHGMTTTTLERKKTASWQYDVVDLGYKANMPELAAALGAGQMQSLEKDQAKREKIAARYIKRLAPYDDFLEVPQVRKSHTHGWHLFIIRLHTSRLDISRDDFIEQMAKRGIECGVHYIPAFHLSFYREALGLSEQYFPNAAYAGRRVVSLPIYPSLKLSDVDRVCAAIGKLLTKHGQSKK